MKFDLSLQKYVEWEVSNVMPLKGKFGYRVFLIYMDGSKKPQQKAGFATEKEANAARDKTIGELYSGTYVVYANALVKDLALFSSSFTAIYSGALLDIHSSFTFALGVP